MHFAIVEDLAMDQEHLIQLIQEIFKKHNETADFDCYESGEDFLEHFRPGLYHAVFMDIMLDKKGLNGIETAEKLRSIAERIPLIFITSERDYSLQGYRVHPLDYLLKPVDANALSWCLDEIRTFLAEPAYIEIQASLGQGQTTPKRISLDDVLYAETQNHRLIIHTLKENITARLSLTDLLALLPKSGRFYMSGRGLLLNFSQVADILDDGAIHLKNDECIFCSRRKKKKPKKLLWHICLTLFGKERLYELASIWKSFSLRNAIFNSLFYPGAVSIPKAAALFSKKHCIFYFYRSAVSVILLCISGCTRKTYQNDGYVIRRCLLMPLFYMCKSQCMEAAFPVLFHF